MRTTLYIILEKSIRFIAHQLRCLITHIELLLTDILKHLLYD